MIYHHNLNPIAFSILNVTVPWYWLNYLFGYFFVYFFCLHLIKKLDHPLSLDHFKYYSIFCWIGLILGARIGYILIYNLDYYLANPTHILQIWLGGMSFHGALISSMLFLYIVSKKFKHSIFLASDLLVIPIGFIIFTGRITNFINAELIGIPTNSNWGVVYSHKLNSNNSIIAHHPSALYQAFLEGLMVFIIMMVFKNKIKTPGFLTGLFLICYGAFRFICEFYRLPDPQIGYLIKTKNILTTGQALCALMIIIGLIIFSLSLKNKKRQNISSATNN